MKPPAPPTSTSKKGKGGGRGQGGTTNGVTFAPDLSRIGSTGSAAPRSAAEYQPPDSFLEGIQRPTGRPGAGGQGNRTESVIAELFKF